MAKLDADAAQFAAVVARVGTFRQAPPPSPRRRTGAVAGGSDEVAIYGYPSGGIDVADLLARLGLVEKGASAGLRAREGTRPRCSS